jgi:peptidoglycan-associated lipoprotein
MPGVESPIAFGVLIERLRLHGFTVATADCLRMQDLLERIVGQCAPGEIKTLLCPIFARSREQQKIFYEVFDDFWREAELGAAAERVPIGLPPARESADAAPPPKLRVRRMSARTLAAGLALVLVLAGFAVYLLLEKQPVSVAPPITEKTPPKQPPSPPETTQVTHEGIVARARFVGPLRTAAALGVVTPLVWLVCFLWIRRSERKEAEAVLRHYKPPYWWDVRPKVTPLECYRTEKFYTAARKLRLRLASGRQVLALRATILATVRQRGYPSARYRTVTRPADYLCLIRRNSPEDHRAGLFEALVSGLATEEVSVHRYFFESDAGLCTNLTGNQTWPLAELTRKFPVSAVLIFGDTRDMFHPVRGDLLAWAEPDETGTARALFTFGRPTTRQARLAAKAGAGIFPANVEGLLAFAELMAIGGKPTVEYIRSSHYPAAKPIPESPENLRASLGRDAYALLCACAAYPRLDWNLTLYLGAALPGGRKSLTEEALTRLVQLPWLQSGGIPERLRGVLARDLELEQTSAVQQALGDLLEHDKPPEGTFAAAARELQLAVFKAHGARGIGRIRRLLGTLRLMPLDDVAPDTTLLQFLDLTARKRQVAALPRRFRERIFRRGVPGLGWTTTAWVLAAAAVVSAAGASFVSLPPDRSLPVIVVTGKCIDASGVPTRPAEVHIAAKLAENPAFTWLPRTGQFALMARPVGRGPVRVGFRGPTGSTFNAIYAGLGDAPWTVTFPAPAKPPDRPLSQSANSAVRERTAASTPNIPGSQAARSQGSARGAFPDLNQPPPGAPAELNAPVSNPNLNPTQQTRAKRGIFGNLVQGAAGSKSPTTNQSPVRPSAQANAPPSNPNAGLANQVSAKPAVAGASDNQTSQQAVAARLVSSVQDVYFDFDTSDIRPDARDTLTRDAAILKQLCADFSGTKLLVEGHTDERGTSEYNLAIGDRRATAVKDFLVELGVPSRCLYTISYGKERPVCTESDATCFQRNSRVHFSVGQ